MWGLEKLEKSRREGGKEWEKERRDKGNKGTRVTRGEGRGKRDKGKGHKRS